MDGWNIVYVDRDDDPTENATFASPAPTAAREIRALQSERKAYCESRRSIGR